MMYDFSEIKQLIRQMTATMYSFNEVDVRKAMRGLLSDQCIIHMPHPLGDMQGADDLYEQCYGPLLAAMPDLERRDWILMAGESEHGSIWVGCAGHYVGTFVAPWLDILPTGHLTHMRFHEFYNFVDGKVTEIQTLWDIPEVMMQAKAWPMAPSLGLEFYIPGPATQDGLSISNQDAAQPLRSRQHIIDMLTHMKRHPTQGGPEVMAMDQYWHDQMNWYGPAGIGTGRGIDGFRNWHQIPFINAMPDRGQYMNEITYQFFGEGNYAAVTGWPNMIQTVTHDGWMGIAPSGQKITLCSLDFWRIENGKIRENWVMVDILDAYRQLGVDVLSRMREFNKVRVHGSIPFPIGDR